MHFSLSTTDVIVLCGGRGTRLGALTREVPKPLLPVGGRPFLLRLLLQWRKEGARRFILSAHYLAEQFRAFAAEYSDVLGKISVMTEEQPLGTGGGIRFAALQSESGTLMVANGDSYVSQPLQPLLAEHDCRGMAFTMVAVGADRVVGGARQKGALKIGTRDELLGFSTEETTTAGWINGGLYALDRKAVLSWPEGPCSLENEILTSASRPRTFVLKSGGVLLDIGTPHNYSVCSQKLGPIENLFRNITSP